jgi:polysaccharide export outer membrane protein
VKKTAFLKSAEITRSVIGKEGVKSHIINVDLDEALKGNPTDNILLDNLDEVVVRRLPDWKEETERYCTLRGEVRFPGVYPILKGERLSSILQRAGGYTDKAYLKGAKFTRKLVRELQQKRMDEVIARTEQEVARKQQELASVAASKEELEATKAALDGMRASLEKLKQAKAEGRISLRITSLDEMKGSPYDLELQGGDALEIPQSTNSVLVFGEVYNPTTVIQLPGVDVVHYLRMAGGATTNADEAEMYVIRADGSVISKREKNSFLFFNSFMAMSLDPGDTIVVPQNLEKVAWMRELKDIAFILGQTALAAGVLVAAGL